MVGLALVACGAAPRDDEAVASTTGAEPPGSSAGTTEPSPAGSEAEASSDPQPPGFDLGLPDVPGGGPGCSKVDFLFVIDSSASMQFHQENLAASFAGFIDAIRDGLDEANDYQIMVVDTDPDHTAICEQYCGFGSPICSGYNCGDATSYWDECDREYGAGVRHPLGWNASNEDCGFGTERFLRDDADDLAGSFACAAKVGTSTNKEWQLLALSSAIAPEITADDGCNAGFLRDDALLVVTLITDEPDLNSEGTLVQWYGDVVSAKFGDPTAVVMLGILPPDVEDPSAVCDLENPDYPRPAPDLHEFVGMFPHALVGDVCAPDYSPFLVDAVALIDDACDGFVPAG